jgi:hypothetical protein
MNYLRLQSAFQFIKKEEKVVGQAAWGMRLGWLMVCNTCHFFQTGADGVLNYPVVPHSNSFYSKVLNSGFSLH